MMINKNGIWKVATRLLAVCLIAFIAWFGNQVWGKQQETDQTVTQQEISIKVLQENIMGIDKTLLRIENLLIEDQNYRKQKDSILQSLALKVEIMFNDR